MQVAPRINVHGLDVGPESGRLLLGMFLSGEIPPAHRKILATSFIDEVDQGAGVNCLDCIVAVVIDADYANLSALRLRTEMLDKPYQQLP